MWQVSCASKHLFQGHDAADGKYVYMQKPRQLEILPFYLSVQCIVQGDSFKSREI